MKIRTRVSLFYSVILLAITLLFTGLFFFTAGNQLESFSRGSLEQAVKEASGYISYYEDRIEIEPDFDFYVHGVTLLMYGPQGTPLLGSAPSGFPAQTPLISDEYQTVSAGGTEWTVYDLYIRHPESSGLWIRGIYSMDGSVRLIGNLQRVLLIAMPAFLLLALCGGWLITKRAFLPVEGIRKAAEEISGGSDLSRRIPLDGPRDELYELASTLDAMIERLQKAFDNERQFASDVSHELRTPLAVIRTRCDYLLSADRKPEEIRESLTGIREQVERMSSLITQLLELSRTAGLQSPLRKETVNLSLLCESVCEGLEEEAEKKSIRILTHLPDTVEAEVDETLFMRLLMNLVTNGIRYGKEGGMVSVSLQEEGENVRLQVLDDGIGIAEEHLEKIFRRLYRVNTSRNDKDGSESFGLGLSFVRWIAEAHGGTVRAESRLGEWTRFTVSIPKGREGEER